MHVVIAADEDKPVVGAIAEHLRARGHDAIVLPVTTWGAAALAVADAVAEKKADFGVVCCWTGTGVSIAANKVPGIRAALCADAQTAAGARKWNDANVLALSLRLTTEATAKEIVDAWLDNRYTGSEDESLKAIKQREPC